MAGAFLNLNSHAKKSLDRIQSKPWSEPIGQALQATADIVNSLRGFIPGAGMIAGALSLGATLLNPQPRLKDLHKEIIELKKFSKSITTDMKEIKDEIGDFFSIVTDLRYKVQQVPKKFLFHILTAD